MGGDGAKSERRMRIRERERDDKELCAKKSGWRQRWVRKQELERVEGGWGWRKELRGGGGVEWRLKRGEQKANWGGAKTR